MAVIVVSMRSTNVLASCEHPSANDTNGYITVFWIGTCGLFTVIDTLNADDE